MTERKNIILIDGHALAFREYYALERTGMRTASGVPTWGVFGFFKSIFDLLKSPKIKVDAIAVAFDVSHHTFRTEAYSEYKANREKMPDDMSTQMGLIYEGLEAFDIPIYQREGYEADDVIGTISKKAVELGHRVYIMTGDKDSFQLVDKDNNVTVIIPSKGEMNEFTWDKIYEKMEVYPDQIVDFKALSGDQSDNIPGVFRIGKKTAIKWLNEYGSLNGIFENIDKMPETSSKGYLIAGKDVAYKCQYLATIIRNLDIDFDFDKACITLPDMNKVTEFLTKMQFFSYLKNIRNILDLFNKASENCAQNITENIEQGQLGLFSNSETTIVEQVTYPKEKMNLHEVETDADYELLYEKIKSNGSMFCIVEAETESLLEQKITSLTIATGDVKIAENGRTLMTFDEAHKVDVFYLAFDENRPFVLPDKIKELFADEKISKFVIDSKRDYNVLRANGVKFNGVKFDALLASYLEKPSANHDIDVQGLQYLNIIPTKDLSLNETMADKLGVADDTSEINKVMRKIWILVELLKYRGEKLSDTNWNLLKTMELPLAEVLADMEFTGVFLNVDSLNELNDFFTQNIETSQAKIYELAGEEFNLNSPRQVGEMLFEKLKLPVKKRHRGTIKYSTSAEVLEDLATDYEIARALLEYRKYSKLKTTYSYALINLINPIDMRVHTTFNQITTVTGRLSSTNPNLQNIPTRTEEGVLIRSAFIPQDANNLIVSADYSQIELRLLAHITKDPALTYAYRNGIDIHTNTAASIYGVKPEDVTKDQRRHAKTVNFGIIYGQTKYGLAKEIGVTSDEAAEFIDRYFQTYSGVKEYMNAITEKVLKDGYVETIFGRIRDVSTEISSSNAMVREFAKRAAANFPMQGSASDMMKLAMIRFYNALKERNLKSKLIIQVHDEMVVETVREELEEVKELLKSSMELDQFLSVPLVVNIKEGESWS